jgi:hypothetical protein
MHPGFFVSDLPGSAAQRLVLASRESGGRSFAITAWFRWLLDEETGEKFEGYFVRWNRR